MGVEQYLDFSGSKAAASGFFIEGRYQRRQVDFGIKIGSPLWVYGTDKNFGSFNDESVILIRAFFSESPAYFEGSFHYKPNFKHAKPFFGIGCRYILREGHQTESITASRRVYNKRELPSYFTPVINVGYYYKNLKFQFNYVLGQLVDSKVSHFNDVYFDKTFNAGFSYIFGLDRVLLDLLMKCPFLEKNAFSDHCWLFGLRLHSGTRLLSVNMGSGLPGAALLRQKQG